MSCDDVEVGAITVLVLVALGHDGGVEVILEQEYVSVYVMINQGMENINFNLIM